MILSSETQISGGTAMLDDMKKNASELSDEEIRKVSGGQTAKLVCPRCGTKFTYDVFMDPTCPVCHYDLSEGW